MTNARVASTAARPLGEDHVRDLVDRASLGERRGDVEQLLRLRGDALLLARQRLDLIDLLLELAFISSTSSARRSASSRARRNAAVVPPMVKRDDEEHDAVDQLLRVRQLDRADRRQEAEVDRDDRERAGEKSGTAATIPGRERHGGREGKQAGGAQASPRA